MMELDEAIERVCQEDDDEDFFEVPMLCPPCADGEHGACFRRDRTFDVDTSDMQLVLHHVNLVHGVSFSWERCSCRRCHREA